MRRLFLLLSVLIFPLFVCADNIPQPVGRVNDFANVISPEYKDKLNTLIQELEAKTSAEIAVVTVNSITPYDEQSYARMLFDNWKPGKKGKDNGVLVLLAIKERRWRIETGYGVEGVLPDGVCGEIGRDYMVPYFKAAKYGAGIYSGVAQIAKVIGKDAGVKLSNLPKPPVKINSNGSGPGIYAFAIFFFYLWNLPWPIFIGLPFTLLFAVVFFSRAPLAGFLVLVSYTASMVTRYFIWRQTPPTKRKELWKVFIFGLATIKSGKYASTSWGGGFGGGGGGGFGGGGGGGGGAGGRF